MKNRITLSLMLTVAVLAAVQLVGVAAATPLTASVRAEIEARLQGRDLPPVVWLDGALLLDTEYLPDFYAARQYAPAWVDPVGLKPEVDLLLGALRDSSSHGLCSDAFRLSFIEPLVQLERDYLVHGVLFDAHYLAILDLLLTDAFFRYARELSGAAGLPAAGLTNALEENLEGGSLAVLLASLEPQQTGYVRLRQALGELRQLAAFGGWSPIPPGPTLRRGAQGRRVELVKQRLYLGGDLEAATAWEERGLGERTVAGIKSFQERHGLQVDGVVGPATRAEMNVPIEERIRQVEVNMMRWRAAPQTFGPRHIRVNIADYALEVHEQGRVVMSMPVVVGTPYRKTPTFSATMSYLEFAPSWYVPATILREDKLPKIRRDPTWLVRNHYELVTWRAGAEQSVDPSRIDWSQVTSRNFPGSLKMLPGPWNPLGQVKFMFPNRYAVYLHDTNERELFSRGERFFSSGCIRIERPLDLVQYLLDGLEGWDCDRILAALQGGATLKVDLPQRIPVHLLYWTAWVDERQRLQFRRDIYLRDADLEVEQAAILEQSRPRAAEGLVRTDLSASGMRR